jgi:DNA-binding response OmpR family regulator
MILLTADMLVASQVSATARAHGWRVAVVGNEVDLAEQLRVDRPRLVLVDLSLPQLDISRVARWVRETDEGPPALVAFGPHVHTAKLSAAAAAGCDRVLARGQLSRNLKEILRDYLSPPSLDTHPSPNPDCS